MRRKLLKKKNWINDLVLHLLTNQMNILSHNANTIKRRR